MKQRQRGLFLGFTDARQRPTDPPAGRSRPLCISDEDLRRSLHVVGLPGYGKSQFLEYLLRQRWLTGLGGAVVDPHGELYNHLLTWCAWVQPARCPVVPINPSRDDYVVCFNPFTAAERYVSTSVDRCVASIIKAWGVDSTDQTPTLEHMLKLVCHALVVNDQVTIAEAHHLLDFEDTLIRDYLLNGIREEAIRREWAQIARLTRPADIRAEVLSTRNRLFRFITSQVLKRHFALSRSSLDLRRIMDDHAALLVNLQEDKHGAFGKMDQRIFGAMLVGKFFEAAKGRVELGAAQPSTYVLVLDEFQKFATPDLVAMPAETRKMGLALVGAHQHLAQLEEEGPALRGAVEKTMLTKVLFQLHYGDAKELTPQFFRGQIDFDEVKRIEYSLHFWPRYARDTVSSESTGEQHARMMGSSDTKGTQSGSQWSDSSGDTIPGAFYMDASTMTHFTASGSGNFDSQSAAHTNQEAITDATSSSRSVSDVPITLYSPHREPKEVPWGLDEQVHRLATALTMQLVQHCFIRTPDDQARALLVPFVKPVRLSVEAVQQYEAAQMKAAGAVTKEEADHIMDQRIRELRRVALAAREAGRSFDVPADEPVHSSPDHDTPPPKRPTGGASVDLKPATGTKKPSPGSRGPKKPS